MPTLHSFGRASALGLSLLIGSAAAARAQEQEPQSRAAELAAAQEAKARRTAQPRPGFFERRLIAFEQTGGFQAAGGFGIVPGLFVTSGDIKRGSGPSLGPAFGKLFANGARFQAKAVYSIRSAKVAQVSFEPPPVAAGRLAFGTRVRWQDVPEVGYHGLGDGFARTGVSYAETKTEASATAIVRPARLLRFDAGTGVERFNTDVPSDPAPDPFAGAAGVGADPQYLHTYAAAAVDSRDAEGYTRRGNLLRATWHDYRQQNEGPYSFRRLDGVAEHYQPLLRGNWVIYLGLRASTTMADSGKAVPFFLLPDVGGHDLRGFGNYRFRDRHSLTVTAEYRWYAQEYLEGAIFYDAGKAVRDRSAIDFTGLHSSYGAGIRLHGSRTTALRLELARSREGTRLIFAFSPVGG